MSYENTYRNKITKIAGTKPGHLISVMLNEQGVVCSKLQLCANLPKHSEVHNYDSRTELNKEYERRTGNNEFKRIENIGLIGHIPKFSSQGLHHPLINPDLRLRLIEAAENPFAPFEVSRLDQIDDVGELDVFRGPELEIHEWMKRIGTDAAEAMIWYVGRETEEDRLRDPNKREFSDIGLRTYLFGQITTFLNNWKAADPEISFSEFTKLDGDGNDGYHIKGRFKATPLELKSQEELGIDVPVQTALEDWVRAILLSFLKYSTFEPAEVSDKDVRTGQVGLGDGELKYDDLTPAQEGTYEEKSLTELEDPDYPTYWLVERMMLDVSVRQDEDEVEFQLKLPATN